MKRKRLEDFISEGEPPTKAVRSVESIKFIINDFKNVEGGNWISSPTLKAHGHDWKISCRPGGDARKCNLYLEYRGTNEIAVACALRTRGEAHSMVQHSFTKGSRWYVSFDIAKGLEKDGSFVIEADIQPITVSTQDSRFVWYPPALRRQSILVDLYQDADSEISDVAFHVGENVFKVHKSILSLRCKKLYEITKEYDRREEISIDSTMDFIFKAMLDYIYTVKLPGISNIHVALQLLFAADKYECVDLKLYVESVIVDKFLNPQNTADLLLIADSHSCALLKEAATNMFASNAATIKVDDVTATIVRQEVIDLLNFNPDHSCTALEMANALAQSRKCLESHSKTNAKPTMWRSGKNKSSSRTQLRGKEFKLIKRYIAFSRKSDEESMHSCYQWINALNWLGKCPLSRDRTIYTWEDAKKCLEQVISFPPPTFSPEDFYRNHDVQSMEKADLYFNARIRTAEGLVDQLQKREAFQKLEERRIAIEARKREELTDQLQKSISFPPPAFSSENFHQARDVGSSEHGPKSKSPISFLFSPSSEPETKDAGTLIDRMDVTTLRTELERANLELDGSREVLVNRWKTYCQSQRDNGNDSQSQN